MGPSALSFPANTGREAKHERSPLSSLRRRLCLTLAGQA